MNAATLARPGNILLAQLPPLGAALLQGLLWEFIQPYAWVLFYPAVFAASAIGGLTGGVLATIVSVLLIGYFFVPPELLTDSSYWLPAGVFVATGALFSVMHERLRRALDTSVRVGERRFRALVEHSSDSIALIDHDNRILYLSPSVTAVEGYRPEELLGRSGVEHTHPDDLPVVQEVVAALLANPGKPVPVLWRRRHKDGRWLWLEGVATNLLHEPAVKAIVTNYRDVSGRIQDVEKIRAQLAHLALLDQITRAISERQDLRSILQVCVRSLEEGFAVDFGCVLFHDAVTPGLRVGCIGAGSHEVARLMLLDEQVELGIDRNGLQACLDGKLVYEPDLAALEFPFPQRLTAGGLNAMVMVPLRTEAGVFGLLVTARRGARSFSSSECEFLRQLSEHISLAVGQAQLYTALQRAYDELHATQAAMVQEERLRVLGQMASGIAHDLNNALTPMMVYIELLLESGADLGAVRRHQLEVVQRSVNDAAQTVRRLGNFSKPRDPSQPIAAVGLNRLVQEVLDLVHVRWRDMPLREGMVVNVDMQLDPALPEISGMESDIREALINLVINAVDAMPAGGTLTLATRVEPTRQHGTIVVEVGDTGVGMDEQVRQRCMEPFFTTKGAHGTGLGLPMVYGMARRHDAAVEIDSAPGRGTRVRLVFSTSTAGAGEVEQAGGARMPLPLHILLIDDDPILLGSLCDALQSDGHSVTVAGGGSEGVELFTKACGGDTPFAVVITDLGMPNIDGRHVATAVKRLSPATPVVLLTGWGQRLVDEGDIPSHVNRVLAKPPRLQQLREVLADLCGRAGAE